MAASGRSIRCQIPLGTTYCGRLAMLSQERRGGTQRIHGTRAGPLSTLQKAISKMSSGLAAAGLFSFSNRLCVRVLYNASWKVCLFFDPKKGGRFQFQLFDFHNVNVASHAIAFHTVASHAVAYNDEYRMYRSRVLPLNIRRLAHSQPPTSPSMQSVTHSF